MATATRKHSRDGDAHDLITCFLAPLAAIGCAYLAPHLGIDSFAGGVIGLVGCLAALFVNPDLDQPGLTNAEMHWKKVPMIGTILSGLWIALWGPYTRLIPRHRHWKSHAPVIGTAGRVLYLAAATFVIWGVAALCGTWLVDSISESQIYTAGACTLLAFCALALADLGHAIRDLLVGN